MNRDVDVKTGEFFWPQVEIEKRFRGLQKDFKAGLAAEVMMLVEEVNEGNITEEEYDHYIRGFEAACEMMGVNIENRFNEITRKLR